MQQYPFTSEPTQLEREILKFRAFEIVQLLFQIEQFKTSVLNSFLENENFISLLNNNPPRISKRAKDVYKKLWELLVKDQILTQEQSDEIQELIDYRNTIAHRIHHLTSDVSRSNMGSYVRSQYNNEALGKIKKYAKLFEDRWEGVHVLSLDHLAFDLAERTYSEETKRLDKKISKLIRSEKNKIDEANSFIKNLPKEIKSQCYHPKHIARNGTLTKTGIEYCYQLFSLNAPTIAICHLMKISKKSIDKRRKMWLKSTLNNSF